MNARIPQASQAFQDAQRVPCSMEAVFGHDGPQNTIRIVGMSRSGNHAIINWVLAQLPGAWSFLNCVDPKSDPFATARPLAGGHRMLSNAGPGEGTLLFSLEDTFLKPALGPEASRIQGIRTGPAAGLDVLILRDPYNLMASRRRFGWSFITPSVARRIWKQHARTFIERRAFSGRRLLPVSYNRWLTDAAYRAGLAKRLGLRFTDAPMNIAASCAGGSSFDGMAPPHAEKLLSRWRTYSRDSGYRAMIDTEMVDLADTIFGIANPLTSGGARDAMRGATERRPHRSVSHEERP